MFVKIAIGGSIENVEINIIRSRPTNDRKIDPSHGDRGGQRGTLGEMAKRGTLA